MSVDAPAGVDSRFLVDGSGRGPEARIPRKWMRADCVVTLSDNAYRVWVALWSFADSQTGRSCYPSIARLCAVTGKSRATLYRATAELEKAGLIRKHKRTRSTTDYVLTDPLKVTPPDAA